MKQGAGGGPDHDVRADAPVEEIDIGLARGGPEEVGVGSKTRNRQHQASHLVAATPASRVPRPPPRTARHAHACESLDLNAHILWHFSRQPVGIAASQAQNARAVSTEQATR